MTYDDWHQRVDQHVWRIAGVSIDDLPDVPLRDWFDDETPPASAARRAIRCVNDEDEDDEDQ